MFGSVKISNGYAYMSVVYRLNMHPICASEKLEKQSNGMVASPVRHVQTWLLREAEGLACSSIANYAM